VTEVADLTNAAHPHLHFFLSLGHQVECTGSGLDNEYEMVLKFLPNKARACMPPYSTFTEVYHADGLVGVLVPVVLQDIRVATHATPPEDKPALAPGLQKAIQHAVIGASALASQALPRTLCHDVRKEEAPSSAPSSRLFHCTMKRMGHYCGV
jgi:hypothetical protein